MLFHIGGYPPNYNKVTKPMIAAYKPQLFISGHSHILKVIYDSTMTCLHINPGAAGKQGWHKVKTLIKIDIDGTDIKNCQIIELGTRV
jgi:predicted phosphodiesterase